MYAYIIRRLGFSVLTLFGITLLVFLMIHLIPGDPAELMLGEEYNETTKALLDKRFGLDRPLYEQYFLYIGRLLKGDMGRSLYSSDPVIEEILRRAGATFELALVSLFFSSLIAIPTGVLSATRPYSKSDYTSMTFSFLGLSMPAFWVGIMLMLLFSLKLPLLPSMGRGEPLIPALGSMFRGDFSPIMVSIKHLILPTITLGFHNAAFVARMTRAAMMEVLNQDYIRTARSKGLAEKVVIYRHAFRNALIPIVTFVGLQFGFLLGGSVLTETVFSWPGIGRFIIESILARDYPSIQGAILFFGTCFLCVNFMTDLLYGFIDPRVRYD